MSKRTTVTLAALFIIAFVFVFTRQGVHAVSLTFLSDTLTRLQVNTPSSHTISFLLPETKRLESQETIEIDFGEDNGKWLVDGPAFTKEDFIFNDGTKRNITGVSLGDPVCPESIGLDDLAVGIDDTEGLITIKSCGFYAPSDLGANITLKIGKVAGGKNRIINPEEAGSAIILISYQTSKGLSIGKLAVPIMESDGVNINGLKETANERGKFVLGKQVSNIKKLVQTSSEKTLSLTVEKKIGETCSSDNFLSSPPTF